MQKTLKKIFSSDALLTAIPVAYLIANIGYVVCLGITSVTSLIELLIIVLMCFGVSVSYKKHEKNVMKGLMAGVLTVGLIENITYIDENIAAYGFGFDAVIAIVLAALTGGIFIIHFVLASDHGSNPKVVMMNQIFILSYILINIVWLILSPYPNHPILYGIIDVISACSICALVVCVETKVDEFKRIRETKK